MNAKNKILESVKFVQKELHYTLIYEDWGNSLDKCACPMSCLLIKENVPEALATDKKIVKAAEILSVSEEWVDSFIDGWDAEGYGSRDYAKNPDAWTLGQELKHELNPVEYYKFMSSGDCE